MHNYAHIDDNNTVIGLYQFDEQVDVQHYILSDEASLGDIYDSQTQLFTQPPISESPTPSLPVFDLKSVNISSLNASLTGNIWWLPQNEPFTLTASIAELGDTQLMVMAERVVNATQPIDDIRFVANIAAGVFTMQGVFEQSGNYLITAERLNAGLERIGAPFRLAFETLEFDAYVPTSEVS